MKFIIFNNEISKNYFWKNVIDRTDISISINLLISSKIKKNRVISTSMVYWLARLTANQEVSGSIPGYTLEIFLEV